MHTSTLIGYLFIALALAVIVATWFGARKYAPKRVYARKVRDDRQRQQALHQATTLG